MAEMSSGPRVDAGQGIADGLLAELDGGDDPCVVGGAEAGEALVDVERKDEMAKVDAAVDERRLMSRALPSCPASAP